MEECQSLTQTDAVDSRMKARALRSALPVLLSVCDSQSMMRDNVTTTAES